MARPVCIGVKGSGALSGQDLAHRSCFRLGWRSKGRTPATDVSCVLFGPSKRSANPRT